VKKKAKKPAKAKINYYWFQGGSVAELLRRLQAAGPDARFQVHPDGDSCTLQVFTPSALTASTEPPINESHPCPPLCE
jgi:hypothetical protein